MSAEDESRFASFASMASEPEAGARSPDDDEFLEYHEDERIDQPFEEDGDTVNAAEPPRAKQQFEAIGDEEIVELIPPPPMRCVPEGDDESSSENYQEEVNRLARCKRWERKHGMSIAQYWDSHGINSKLETGSSLDINTSSSLDG